MVAVVGPVTGVLLAGGAARRMGGGDKCLRLLHGRPLLAHVLARIQPQIDALALNANGDPARLAAFGLPVIADDPPGRLGPLAGILAGLDWTARHHPGVRWMASVPTDAPFLPPDLCARLAAALAGGADMACAASRNRHHPVVGLWPVDRRHDMRTALVAEGIRKVDDWTDRYDRAVVDFPAEPVDPFFNANAPADLDQAERWLSSLQNRGQSLVISGF